MQLINIGFGNIVSANRIVAIVSPESAPIKRIVQIAKDEGRAVDATYGRRTRAVLIMDSGHVILSAVQPETVAGRLDKQDIANKIEILIKDKKLRKELGNNNGKSAEMKKSDRLRLVSVIKNYRFYPQSLRGIEEAIVTSGGVDVKSVNPTTMESKLIPGLYFAGEVLDVDALTGGFNITIALATGYVAGNARNKEEL